MQQPGDIEAASPTEVRRLRWYLNRLRCMTPAEIPFRIGRTFTAHAERYGLFGREEESTADLCATTKFWIHPNANVDAAPYLAAADRVLAGRLDVFALAGIDLGPEPQWNRDPRTGLEAPMQFGKLLDYRNPALVGDIKYLWEPNRHMHLVTLAQAYAKSGDVRFSTGIRRQLESWFIACPYGIGPNWSSALECAIRLINWSVAWQLLGGADALLFTADGGTEFRDRWLHSVRQHMRYIRGHYSRYSSANNHLIGEAAGLYIAGLTWPFWREHASWLNEAADILQRETLLQNAPDGVNREQAVSYQQFELDLLILAMLAGRAAGCSFSDVFESRIEAMIEYLASIMDVGGHVPMRGDSDDGYVVQLSQEHDFCRFRSLLATGALLFERADFRAKAGALDDKSRWLFGPGVESRFEGVGENCHRQTPKRAFRYGGYYILGCDFETDREIRLVADAGPLGYNTTCAHGHADALSFTLSLGGLEMLIDPGTYSYRADCPWRAYFRGTAAHNTLRIDGENQSEPGGNFMWLHKAQARCAYWQTAPSHDIFEGWHDGYTRLADPVLHWRLITLNKTERRIFVEDRLEMCGTHDVELFFHFSEHCSIERLPDGFVVRQAGATMQLRPPRIDGAYADIYRGSTAPIRGWVSRRFGSKLPSPTVVWQGRLTGPVVLRTELRC